MKRVLLTIALTLTPLGALPLAANTCAEQIAQSLASPDALESLAQSIEITPGQLKYFLENEKLADRVQALLIAKLLISERSDELIAELYWRAQGTTRYSQTASTLNRITDWIYNRQFWSPLYRNREELFSDSLSAINETLPTPLLISFKRACARVEEPGFLKGLRAVSRELKPAIELLAKREFKNLRDEIPGYLSEKRGLLWRLLTKASKPQSQSRFAKPGPPKPQDLINILNREVFSFLGSVDNLPHDIEVLHRQLDRYTEKELKHFPKIAGTVKGLVTNLHFEITPATYEEFSDWMRFRFEKLLRLERDKLLKEWRERPGSRPRLNPLPMNPTEPHASEVAEEATNISDSDEMELAELELFADTAPISDGNGGNDGTVDRPPKAKRPTPRFRTRREAPEKAETESAQTANTGFLVVLNTKARSDLNVLARSPKLHGQIRKCLDLLAKDPKHPSLRTHVGHGATQGRADSKKVFRSSINMAKGGYRIHWTYGDEERTIEVLEIVHHDEM